MPALPGHFLRSHTARDGRRQETTDVQQGGQVADGAHYQQPDRLAVLFLRNYTIRDGRHRETMKITGGLDYESAQD